MPINYLELQPQISEYCIQARQHFLTRPQKVETAIALLKRFSEEYQRGAHQDVAADIAASSVNRAALPALEPVDRVHAHSQTQESCALLASDGSQISSTHHDALPLSMINTSTVFMQPGSGDVPQVKTQTEFIRAQDGSIATGILPEQWVNTARDVRELQVLANYTYSEETPLIVLGDGPLELFQEPRSGEAHQILFQEYLQALTALCRQNRICAGYTDKPRANLVLKLLEFIFQNEPGLDINGIADADIFSLLLPPASRSSLFGLHSPSSNAYRNEIALHFFYLNVGTANYPWIVRVEIAACTANQTDMIALLQQTLLDQCALMGSRPYPYILHRAHEEAVVHFEERENVIGMLMKTLLQMGIDPAAQSNKLNAKELAQRTRLK